MKVSIGFKLQSGPWGGGNLFGKALHKYLQDRDVEVMFDLQDSDLDIILLTEPRPTSQSSAFTDKDILRYLRFQNPNALVVHRVNECDERKGTHGVNRTLMLANRCVDCTVFVSDWLRQTLTKQGQFSECQRVILNGSDPEIFHADGYQPWDGQGPLRLVTHHWGASWLKGFDIYSKLDDLLATDTYRNKIDFTYIGNLPDGFEFKNATYIPPRSGVELADLIRQHHVYITASRNEPGSNHQNEGALCGLPLFYLENASMPEYCHDFGLGFQIENFEQKLDEMSESYAKWVVRMKDFSFTTERTCAAYYQLFEQLLAQRQELIEKRQWPTRPTALLESLMPKQMEKLLYRIKKRLAFSR